MTARAPLLIVGTAVALAILFTSALPTQAKFALHTQGALHPWLHVLSFAILALLMVSALRSPALRLLLIGLLLCFGYLTEARESHKDGWPIERKDVQLDTIGTLLGATLAFVRRRQSQ